MIDSHITIIEEPDTVRSPQLKEVETEATSRITTKTESSVAVAIREETTRLSPITNSTRMKSP